MQMKDMFGAMLAKTGAGEDTVLVTIVAETGSSPRSAGAHMLVHRDGRVWGSIGGGTVEYAAIRFAGELLERRQSRRKTYRLHPNDEEELGMICGGDVEIFFQFIPGGDAKTIALLEECLGRLDRDEDLWLLMDLGDSAGWTMSLYGAGLPPADGRFSAEDIKALARNKAVLVQSGGRRLYGEPVNFAGRAIIFGGGHVAQALAPVLGSVGFRCVIFDNREEYVSRELFPAAYDLIAGDYERADELTGITPHDYIVIVTHAFDLAVLRRVIFKPCAYIGVIGSKTKTAAVKAQLRAEGAGEDVIRFLCAPIGLPIRSETPEEIAVSIAGEMILRRAERRAALTGNSPGA
jgi:xanthine dehydrogenase accessory factor